MLRSYGKILIIITSEIQNIEINPNNCDVNFNDTTFRSICKEADIKYGQNIENKLIDSSLNYTLKHDVYLILTLRYKLLKTMKQYNELHYLRVH